MQAEVCLRLLDINDQFYQNFAGPFNATRQRLQPGVRQVIEALPSPAYMLDLGCGNGTLARALIEHGQAGLYLGLDNSPGLLEAAQAGIAGLPHPGFSPRFARADLAGPDWPSALAAGEAPFDVALAFAVLHHLPGEDLRLDLLRRLSGLLKHPGGRFFHSEWQFLNSPRLAGRVLPWETVGLSSQEVDPGDYLLDWRSGGQGLRYAHHFSEAELSALARSAGFRVVRTFFSDGENGRLGLYQEWEAGSQDEG